jgi:hypothetical protein
MKIKYKLYDKICFITPKLEIYIGEIYGINITEEGIIYLTRGINRPINKYHYRRKIHQKNVVGLLNPDQSIERYKDDLIDKDINQSILIKAVISILEKDNIIKK